MHLTKRPCLIYLSIYLPLVKIPTAMITMFQLVISVARSEFEEGACDQALCESYLMIADVIQRRVYLAFQAFLGFLL